MKKINLQFTLPVSILKEGKIYVAYTPALDLSTSGKTFEQVKKRFVEVVHIFFEELLKKNTIDDVLKELGWHKSNTKWFPPVLVSQESQNIEVAY